MRGILEVFSQEKGRHLSITTKSDLVTRDLDLLREIARRNVLSINITITTLNRRLARLMEPRAPRPDLRLAAVEALTGSGLHAGVFPNPILPMITDSEESLDALAAAAKGAGAQYFGGGPLFLMPCAQKIFLSFPVSGAASSRSWLGLTGSFTLRAPTLGPRLQGAVARARGAHSRAVRPGAGAGRVSAGVVGG